MTAGGLTAFECRCGSRTNGSSIWPCPATGGAHDWMRSPEVVPSGSSEEPGQREALTVAEIDTILGEAEWMPASMINAKLRRMRAALSLPKAPGTEDSG